MIDLDEMEMFSKSMIERGIGNMESGASCYQTIELIERLRQAEKDAARYRWLLENARLGIGRNGKDWDLQVDGPAPDSISEVSAWIDSHPDLMDGKAKCQHCGSQFGDFTEEAEFIGWHGMCVKCFLSEECNA